ncbi:uncharacterized protein HD556DRAFT_1325702 [Suillus plorans]|uniref:Aprataxin and PNK-like factor PBZ domain-containing protein n=1 Tax=Suillus plorans TaxID=116603 RepID=A0A9P7DW21_9AGAM|nr:uncharacterized protein HD556DRAFT_1325702 [Suillus plorans]KAG1804713.1 hypothetical protein HD556DRAFT_1325702 [Suillus plorans]
MGNTVHPMHSSFVNADLVECFLRFLPDFQCLASTILTSKAIYNVFQQHPRSVVRSVAYNLIGPALPQALRFVRCKNAQLYYKPVDELLGEDDIQKNPVLSSEDITSLVGISTSVQELESLFSWRMKDRRFKTSQLSLAESTRFQKAMYRMSLFSAVYGCNAHESAIGSDSDQEEIDSALEEAKTLRKGFFGSLSTPELRDIQWVETFLRGVITRDYGVCFSTIPPEIYSPESSFVLYCAPHHVIDVYKRGLDCITEWDSDITEEILFYNDFIIEPLTSVLVDRTEQPLLPVTQKQPIIDEIVGEHDRCSQCRSDTVKCLDLWGPSNWGYLWGTPPLYSIEQLLKGHVGANLADRAHFLALLCETPAEDLVGGLFDYKTPAYSTWNKADWLCPQCLEKFVRDHLHIWYLGQKVKRGDVIPDNCWYGYNCRTQTHRLAHAQKLNHWCEPTRGDAPPTNV